MTGRAFPQARAELLASRLEIGLDLPICFACLSFVSLELDAGDPVGAARQARRMTPYIWDEGLAEPALEAVRHACENDVAHAHAGLADLELRGGRSAVARAIVLRLAGELSRRVHAELRIVTLARDRLPLAPPELN